MKSTQEMIQKEELATQTESEADRLFREEMERMQQDGNASSSILTPPLNELASLPPVLATTIDHPSEMMGSGDVDPNALFEEEMKKMTQQTPSGKNPEARKKKKKAPTFSIDDFWGEREEKGGGEGQT